MRTLRRGPKIVKLDSCMEKELGAVWRCAVCSAEGACPGSATLPLGLAPLLPRRSYSRERADPFGHYQWRLAGMEKLEVSRTPRHATVCFAVSYRSLPLRPTGEAGTNRIDLCFDRRLGVIRIFVWFLVWWCFYLGLLRFWLHATYISHAGTITEVLLRRPGPPPMQRSTCSSSRRPCVPRYWSRRMWRR